MTTTRVSDAPPASIPDDESVGRALRVPTGVVGRFAPSPTGPLHFGSLVAALGSWLFARSVGGRWLVRMEDLDTPRVVPGSAVEILEALQRYGLQWDGDVMMQSQRTAAYEEALGTLRERGLSYDCACSRAELQGAASAPAAGDPVESAAPIYPGTCRNGVAAGKRPRATRFRVPSGIVAFQDAVAGAIEEDLARATGDFVVRRADGPFAYQLAVVVDDAAQNVSQVVRGGDLLSSTARQIALQRALDLATPRYAHLPLILGADGAKLGKRDGALTLPTLDRARVEQTLAEALALLGIPDVRPAAPDAMLDEALNRFDPRKIPRGPIAYGG